MPKLTIINKDLQYIWAPKMKNMLLSIGKNVDCSKLSEFTKQAGDLLDSQELNFEGSVAVIDSYLSDNLKLFLEKTLNHMSNDLGMILDVLFFEKEIPKSTLQIVRCCERFSFLDKAEIILPTAKRPVETFKNIRFVGSDPISNIHRGLYFGLDRATLGSDGGIDGDTISGFEVIGDIEAFKSLQSTVKKELKSIAA